MRLRVVLAVLVAFFAGLVIGIVPSTFLRPSRFGVRQHTSFPIVWEMVTDGTLFVSAQDILAVLPLRNRAGEQSVYVHGVAVCNQGIFYYSPDDSSIAHIRPDGSIRWVPVPEGWERCQVRCSKKEVFVNTYRRVEVGDMHVLSPTQAFRLKGNTLEHIADTLEVEAQPDCDDYATLHPDGHVCLRHADGQVYHSVKLDKEPRLWSVDFSAKRIFSVGAGAVFGFGENQKKTVVASRIHQPSHPCCGATLRASRSCISI